MKVIALKGEKDSGKSTTLKEVYKILKAAGGEKKSDCYKDLEGKSKDLRDVINFAGKKIGIVTQGDYGQGEEKKYKNEINLEARTSLSVRDHLVILEGKGCDIAICACTINKENIEKDIKTIIIGEEKDIKFIDKDGKSVIRTIKIENKVIKTTFIDKEKSKDESLQQIENTQKAMEIIQILKLWLLNATE